MAFRVVATTTNKIENYTTPRDVTGSTSPSCDASSSPTLLTRAI